MERVDADPQMEGVLARSLGDVLVGADTGGFESLRRELFVLVGDKVNACREVVDRGALAAEIVDSDLGVWNTSVES